MVGRQTTRSRRSRRTWVAIYGGTAAVVLAIAVPAAADQVNQVGAAEVGGEFPVMAIDPGQSHADVFTLTPKGSGTCHLSGPADFVTVSVVSNAPAVATVAPATLTFGGCGQSNAQSITVHGLQAGVAGVFLTVTGQQPAGPSFDTSPASFVVAVRPTSPGTPRLTAGRAVGKTGRISLGWTHGGAVKGPGQHRSYALVSRNDAQSTNQVVAKNLLRGHYRFGRTNPLAEGTYHFGAAEFVNTLDNGKSYLVRDSSSSRAVVVDKTAPRAPRLVAHSRTAPVHGWYRHVVRVVTHDRGDPGLADGSAGSGVSAASVHAPVRLRGTGRHTLRRHVSDQAGNVSATTTRTYAVDRSRPTVTLACPSGSPAVGSTVTAAWRAHDVGSGLRTASHGTVSRTATQPGRLTLTAPRAVDLAGNVSRPVSCSVTTAGAAVLGKKVSRTGSGSSGTAEQAAAVTAVAASGSLPFTGAVADPVNALQLAGLCILLGTMVATLTRRLRVR